ncbi:MAG TPA: molybdenum ABC transporter ATP-binding protein [Polyangiaceae bacterium]|nr:molybdenum ABC transporter ATP-binding protein [Polyangiaceae bacterium]
MHPPGAREAPGIAASLRFARGPFRIELELALPARGIAALFGPSGSGKTTCLRLLAGLDRGEGTVRVLGEPWQDDARGLFVPVHRRGVGYVFQDHALLAHLSVEGNLDYGRRRARPSGRIDAAVVIGVLGIGALLARRPEGLSGGERQRVAIAQALLAQPRVLFLDEPLAALDGARKQEILPYLERLRDELAIPVVYVSHAMDEVARLADHLVLLDGGRVVASGPIGELLARLDLPTAMADDAGVVIEGTVAGHDEPNGLTRIRFAGGELWVGGIERPLGAPLRARALARDVSLALQAPGPSSVLNVLPARVVEVRDLGPDRVNVRLAVGEAGEGGVTLLARITRRSQTALGLGPGVAVHALIKSVALLA